MREKRYPCTVGLCPGPYGGPGGWAFSYERGEGKDHESVVVDVVLDGVRRNLFCRRVYGSTRCTTKALFPHNYGGTVTKFIPQKTLSQLRPGKLTFGEECVVHRVAGLHG